MDKNSSYYHINETIISDIWPIDVGQLRKASNKPIVNNYPYFLIHFVYKGKGYIEIENKKYIINKNHLFVIFPDTDVKYYPDKKNPWNYYWINVNGLKVLSIFNKLGITKDNFLINEPLPLLKKFFENAYNANEKKSATFIVQSQLFMIFSAILENSTSSGKNATENKSTFENIFNYINENILDEALSARTVAEHFHLNINYFSTLFKNKCNVRFKEYVNYERIKKASDLLITTNEPIKNIAIMVGFIDQLYFTKVFNKYRLMSPKEFRKENKK